MYEERSQAYRIYDIEAWQVVISRDVTFDKTSVDGASVHDVAGADDATEPAARRLSSRPRRNTGLEQSSEPGSDSDFQDFGHSD